MFAFFKKKKARDEISKANFQEKEERFFAFFFFVFSVFSFFFLIIRLFSFTVVKGEYYKRLSSNNRLKEVIVEAPRGSIFDRKGYLLVESRPPDISFLTKQDLRINSKRDYLFLYAPHFIGYIQEVDKKEIGKNCFYTIKAGDRAGKVGIERLFDCVLRGENGKKLVEVDALGRKLREIAFFPPKKGIDLRVSLDSLLQEFARKRIVERELDEKKIAVVGVKPDTGEILLYISYPDFDLNEFVQGGEKTSEYLASEDRPLFDRVSKGVYPPGSTFKPFVAIAALEEKVIDEKTLIKDTGVVKLGDQTFGNWYFLKYGRTDGQVNVVKALARSNDIFFYKIGEKLGEELIGKWAIKFGFSKLTNIGFDESMGVVPSDFWKRVKIGSRWYLGDTYNLSIGQGYLLVTPLQLAMATSSLVNGGKLCQPLVLKAGSASNNLPYWAKEIVVKHSTPFCVDLKISEKSLEIVKQGMYKACQKGGTASVFFDFEREVGCKTGTAESERPSGLPHAWFTVFAPFEKPEIVLTVLVEESGEGSSFAAPLARDILEFYFERKD